MDINIGLNAIFGPYLATLIGFMLAGILFAYLLRRHERQSASIAWFLLVILLPFIGVPAYLLLAGRKLEKKARQKHPLQSDINHDAVHLRRAGAQIENIMRGYGLFGASGENHTELITSGAHAYGELMAQIDAATVSIHISTFILGRDPVGRAIVKRLSERAEQGIQVRLLVDALGSFTSRFTLLPKLERAGGQTGSFMRVLPVHRKWKANLRNHRKLAIFDGRIAIAGGMNLAEQYMGAQNSHSHWLDTNLKIEGPAVRDLHTVFTDDWQFATGEILPEIARIAGLQNHKRIVQIVPSGPDVQLDALYDAIVAAIYKAQQRIWIVTPYFVPDDGLMRALLLQARLGIDVRVILPRRSDHWIADMARGRFVRSLSEAGVRFFAHRSRMMHAKHVLVDDTVAISGSANLDMRSMYLNYELALFCYDDESVVDTQCWISEVLAQCDQYQLSKPSMLRRLAEDLCWLAAPLL
jgi:cardiolipin synthase